MFDGKAYVASLPRLPGVYRMLGEGGEVLYVGKARDLQQRVASYFQQSGLSPRIRLMVGQIAAMEVTVTQSEAEALLLENNLIKSLSPKYNILFRDDKSYPYIMLSGHRFPRLAYYRGPLDRRNRYFGPYPNAGAVRESLQLLQKVFRLRTCEDSVFANRSRPCLLHQIRRCSGPCVELIDAAGYAADVRNAESLLAGRAQQLIDDLTQAMLAASEAQEYEQAAQLRDQIAALCRVRERQFVSSGRDTDADVVACVSEGGVSCVNLVMVRGGRHLGDRSFFPQNADPAEVAATLRAFLAQHYLERGVPPLLIVNQSVDDPALAEILASQRGGRVQISTRPAGERRVWLEMAEKNARLAIAQRLLHKESQESRLLALQQALDLADGLRRIECFDISHTQGEATVAACVVYDDGAMQPGEYRRYNIEGITPGDDYAAMRDAVTRRYRKLPEGEGRVPDLVLIDGGKGQLAAAREALAEIGAAGLYLIGVAKGEARKPGLEQLIVPERENPLQLAADHPGLHLIQQVRDEAHRFAVAGHRARRGKARTASTLERIPGVGPRRRQRLLTRFGGLKGVTEASVDELARTEGISHELAERIYRELH